MRVIWIALLGVALLAGSASGRVEGRLDQPGRLLDAQGRVREDHLGLPEDTGRKRGRLQPVVRRLGRPGPRGRGGAAGGPRRALARPGRQPARAEEARPEELGRELAPRDRLRLGRRLRRSRRQPEEDQGLGRPGQERHPGDHAEPVHLGRRTLERDGRLRGPAPRGQDRQAGDRIPVQALQARAGAAGQRPRRRCRSSRRARATSCSRTRTRRSTPNKKGVHTEYRRAEGDAADRDAGRADEERDEQAGREGVLQVPLVVARRRRRSPTRATGRWSRAWRRATTSTSRRASSRSARPSTD